MTRAEGAPGLPANTNRGEHAMTQPVRVAGWVGALLLAGAGPGLADGPRCRAQEPKERACLIHGPGDAVWFTGRG